jgi:SAM-dependent methyltransferase
VEKQDISWPWDVGELPFQWGLLDTASNLQGLPDRLPFSLEVDLKTGRLAQSPNERTDSALEKAYGMGSVMAGVMHDDGISRKYGEAFIAFILQVCGRSKLDGMRVLDIGSGTGFLLRKLQALGAEVLGVEPGIHGQEASKKYGIPVIQSFFPSDDITGTFDLVLFALVLEHAASPVDFLAEVRPYLNTDGHAILSVPDCEPYITCGDLSPLVHEHWSYFTKSTLTNTIRCCGGTDVQVIQSPFGGCLYAHYQTQDQILALEDDIVKDEMTVAHRYRRLCEKGMRRFAILLTEIQDSNKTVGIYVPGRLLNALAVSGVDVQRYRFFDDDECLHGQHFPGIPIKVESRQDLLDCPTDVVLIISHTFGDKIREEIQDMLPSTTDIKVWNDIFG